MTALFICLLVAFAALPLTADAQDRETPPYNSFLTQTGTPITSADAENFVWEVGDDNHDGRSDLYAIKTRNTGSGSVEVHVLDAASNYQKFAIQTGTPITSSDAPNFSWAVGDHNGDGRGDLYAIKTSNIGTGMVEVHVLAGRGADYQSFLIQTAIPISAADAPNFEWEVGDHTGDGRTDLYAIKTGNTGTGSIEVHVLDAARDYQEFAIQTGTPISTGDASNFDWSVGDHDADGRSDVYGIKTGNTGTNKIEVHVLAGRGYGSFSIQTGTPLQLEEAGRFAWAVGNHNARAGDDLYALKLSGTGTNSVEVHVLNSAATSVGDGSGDGDERGPGTPKPAYFATYEPLPIVFVHGHDRHSSSNCSNWTDLDDFLIENGFQPGARVAYYVGDKNCGVSVGDHGSHEEWHHEGGHSGPMFDPKTNNWVRVSGHGKWTSIKHLGYHFAHYIWDEFSSRDQSVVIFAHSMGGLIVRYALAKVARGQTAFPDYLLVRDVVTFGTPHAGTGLCDHIGEFGGGRQCDEMEPEPDSPFMRWLRLNARNPQGSGGTDWTLMASFPDKVVNPDISTMDMPDANHQVVYEWPEYGHSDWRHAEGGRGPYTADVRYRDRSPIKIWRDAPRAFRWIFQAATSSDW